MGAAPSTVSMQTKLYVLKCKDAMDKELCVINDLTSDSTFENLVERVSESAKIPACDITLSWGFPRQEQKYEKHTKLGNTTLTPKETVIVKQIAAPKTEVSGASRTAAVQTTPHSSSASSRASYTGADAFLQKSLSDNVGFLVRRQVPANNSCLFTSINYLVNDAELDLRSATMLRQQIASVIEEDPQKYDEAFLGKPNNEYCKWIKQDESWGGGIEIAILCDLMRMEIDVIDVAAGRVTKFAEDRSYSKRMFLYYDQVHYDPVVLEYVDGDRAECLFSTSEARYLELAQELAKEAHSTKDFTDVKRMTMRCLVCNAPFEQPRDAHIHAEKTGHANFAETR